MRKRSSFAITLIAISSITACGNLPKNTEYQRPALVLPASLPAGAAATDPNTRTSVELARWWTSFHDPVLNAYMAEAASNSQDLVLASARIAEARATWAQNEANLYPSVDLNSGATRRRASENSASFNKSASPYSNDRQLGLSASYEIDFWGKFASADKAARARTLSQEANRSTVLISLYANVAQSYFALRALDTQAALAEQTLGTRRENLRLQKRRFDAGVIGEIDFRQADAEAAAAQATLLTVQQNRRNAESALALLVGRSPASILQPQLARGADLPALYAKQAVPSDLPSDLLSHRPDLLAAEQTLIAANADIAQARSAYFPRISLTASLGDQSKDLSTLLNPASLFWNVVGNLTQPIFRAGAIDALVGAANAREQQAVAQYTQVVQSAFRDVHDALNNVQAGRELNLSISQRIEALRSTLRLADLRYKNGYSSYLEVLNAQRDLAQAESGLVDVQRAQLNAVVALYKAVGGGLPTGAKPTAR